MENYIVKMLSANQSESFFQLIHTNRERLEDFFAGTVACTKTLSDTIDYCREIEQKIKERVYFPYVIIEKSSQEIIGFIDIKNIDWNIPKAELGAFIDSKYEGKGIITNTMSSLIDTIVNEHHFKKLLCRISSRNVRSINVALNSGFELEGTIRCDYKTTKGEIVDLNYYGKVF
ncbi:RimJ/RimL family protein N-acetyltransferase [Aquimarina sp. MAR_2010_214]|uniref:GNAT family N-acetyltransferase n=1 Tax=Aquimarina sp. MAR_2010_214 TaxID=1250026 RepID=UPI000C70B2F5|nr:GNAT family protein [Aquimarina sp. MAR_2010_214]PKV51266.1 RimJ/RimL family protein N-acetyltransferase [Aquimarina sp. MAR_2010_214]